MVLVGLNVELKNRVATFWRRIRTIAGDGGFGTISLDFDFRFFKTALCF
jgi:hypothetical protein